MQSLEIETAWSILVYKYCKWPSSSDRLKPNFPNLKRYHSDMNLKVEGMSLGKESNKRERWHWHSLFITVIVIILNGGGKQSLVSRGPFSCSVSY